MFIIMSTSRLAERGYSMDATVLTAISSIGFPSVMCYLMFKYFSKNSDVTNEKLDKLSDVINNNTVAITRLSERSEINENK